jgi:hypothetical protein
MIKSDFDRFRPCLSVRTLQNALERSKNAWGRLRDAGRFRTPRDATGRCSKENR